MSHGVGGGHPGLPLGTASILSHQRYHDQGELIPGMTEFCSFNVLRTGMQEGLTETDLSAVKNSICLFFHAIKAEGKAQSHTKRGGTCV